MKRILTVAAVALVGLFVLGQTTNLFSYGRTLWSQARTEAKRQVPTKFELERIRQEIASLDGDLDKMIRPVAEYKAAIDRLRREVARAETSLEEQKKVLVVMAEDLKAKDRFVYNGRVYSSEAGKNKLANDFDTYRRAEQHLNTQRKMLDARETSLRASQEQLLKVVNKKKEFELRLVQLEAENETLQIARIGSDIRIDNSRATQIEDALQGLQERLAADHEELIMRTGIHPTDGVAVLPHAEPEVDVDAIRAYLEGGETTAPTRTARNR